MQYFSGLPNKESFHASAQGAALHVLTEKLLRPRIGVDVSFTGPTKPKMLLQQMGAANGTVLSK